MFLGAENLTQFRGLVNVPDSFYELSPAEFKALMAGQKKKREALENAPFVTSAMREMEQEERLKKFKKTVIRVRFPDRVQVQLAFMTQCSGEYN